MIQVQNIADTAEITISGAIGQSWFEEGNTLDTVMGQIVVNDVSNIVVNLKSLGGDLFEALAIYDALKIHRANVTAKIVGATASAGTVIAMSADTVEILENAKFLIHNASTVTMGNADEHEQSAEQLKKFDNDIVNIYRKRTGKAKSEIRDLMKKEIWIDASEAKSWGFVDKVIKTTNKVENYKEYSKILNIKDMELKSIMALLEIDDESKVEATIQNLINKAENVEHMANGLDEATAKIVNLETQIAEQQAAVVNDILNDAVKSGKFKADQRETWKALFEADFEKAKNAVDSIEVAAKMKDVINEKKPDTVVKDYAWYMKNDVKALMEMEQNDKDAFNAIYKTKKQ
jgi:ATP-dependent protease ClpP protease subunit